MTVEELLDQIDDIRGNIPSEVRQARAIVSDRADIIATAKREAEGIVRNAEERARSLIAHEEVVRQAQQKAGEILGQAQQKAREMRRGANDFAEDVLKRTEETMAKHLGELRQARQVLRNPTRPAGQPEDEDS